MITRALVIAPTEREFESVSHEHKVWIKTEEDLLKVNMVDEPPIMLVLHSIHWKRVYNFKMLEKKCLEMINVGIAVITKSETEYLKYLKPIHKRVKYFHVDSLEAARNNYYVNFVTLPYANQIENVVEILCTVQDRMVELDIC